MSRTCCGNVPERETDIRRNWKKVDPLPNVAQTSWLGRKEESSTAGSGRLTMADFQDPEKYRMTFHPCHQEERRRMAEMKRRKIIRKLQKNYQICVNGFNERVTDELIRKMESIERENRERERRQQEKTMCIVTKLLEEQRTKRKGVLVNSISGGCRKTLKKVKKMSPCLSEISKVSESPTAEEEENGTKTPKSGSSLVESPPCERQSQSQESVRGEEDANVNAEGEVFQEREFSSRTRTSWTSVKSIPLEKSLEASPKRLVFQDYKSGQVYLQSLKITNVGLETIHCRYLGIVVQSKEKGRFPIAVALRDSVKLRPGLSCSTKIRLSRKEEAKELECSIVYETRRQRKPLKHSFFFVPVSCVPARAIIRVFPLKIRFPSVTWCAARSANNDQTLIKTFRIKNSGGKECYCRIAKKVKSNEESEEGGVEEMEEEKEEDDEDEKSDSFLESNKTYAGLENGDSTPCEGEEKGGSCQTPSVKALNVAEDFLEELIDNVFDTFRFSEKYHIVVPPFSTKQIHVRFIPEYKGFHQEVRLLLFEDCHNCSEETLELTGDIKKLPLVVEPQIVDMKTCVTNSGVYSATFNVFNTSRGPYSVRLRLPSALKNHAHVHPKGTILQPSSSSEFSVRLYPRLSLSRDVSRYYNQDSGILEFPVFIHPAQSILTSRSDSVKVYVFAVITDYSLEMSPSSIDFGHVTTLETVRASVTLTNRSLSVQDFAFLNLPKEIRIEPNMGFGTVLPMETVTLFLLYSPGVDVLRNGPTQHAFDVRVTTLAECGGFGEKLRDEGTESFESISGECYEVDNPENAQFSTEESASLTPEQVYGEEQEYEFGECYDSDFVPEDDTESETKRIDEETKIRNYLKLDGEVPSDHSFFKRVNLKGSSNVRENHSEPEPLFSTERYEENDGWPEKDFSRRFSNSEPNVIRCVAVVTEPSCQLSESVIQLPSTPCSSFSLYRFRLKGSNECVSSNCTCFSRRNNVRPFFEATFEFQCVCPQIKLEPQTGFLRAGETVPITVIYRPEFPAEDLCRESRQIKAKKLAAENPVRDISGAPQTKSKKSGQSKRNSADVVNVSEIINVSLLELEKYDLFAGERSLQELIGPFHVEAKVHCLVRIVDEDGREKTEIHRLVLVCPAVKPRFVYKGTSQEIDFEKVFVGTKSRRFVEVQNISFERIRPVMSLLNPVGPFLCLSSLRNIPLDPEHILRLPLVYSPSKNGGPEKEYFEIHCRSTNICLVVKGEAVVPEYRFTPNYACCVLESKIGSAEEFKMDVENLNSMKLKLSLVVDYVKEGLDVASESFRGSEIPKENPAGSTDKKKKTESEKKYLTGWEEIPDPVIKDLKRYEKVPAEVCSEMFSVTGTDDSGQILIPAHGKTNLKIKFTPSPLKYDKGEPGPFKRYAVNYRILLEGSAVLKEILVLGIVSRSK